MSHCLWALSISLEPWVQQITNSELSQRGIYDITSATLLMVRESSKDAVFFFSLFFSFF